MWCLRWQHLVRVVKLAKYVQQVCVLSSHETCVTLMFPTVETFKRSPSACRVFLVPNCSHSTNWKRRSFCRCDPRLDDFVLPESCSTKVSRPVGVSEGSRRICTRPSVREKYKLHWNQPCLRLTFHSNQISTRRGFFAYYFFLKNARKFVGSFSILLWGKVRAEDAEMLSFFLRMTAGLRDLTCRKSKRTGKLIKICASSSLQRKWTVVSEFLKAASFKFYSSCGQKEGKRKIRAK